MRQRVKMNGLVSHTTPSGVSYQSGKNKCEQSIKRLQKLINDGYELTGVSKKPTEEENFKIVMVFGKPMKLTIEEYNTHWNFRIDK
jgi:preprotein translocase subunit Sss1